MLFGQSGQVSANFLSGKQLTQVNNAGGSNPKGNIPQQQGFPAGADTIANFTGHYEAQGVFFDGSAHNIWEYSMAGGDPGQGGTTYFNAPVIPVSLDLRNADGSRAAFYDVTPFIQPFMNSPVFAYTNWSSSKTPTQYTDAVQRASLGNHARADWHTLLVPSLKATRTMVLSAGTYRYALNGDGTCCAFVLVDFNTFVNKLFPPTAPPDNSTVIGSAEVAGDITTKDISTFFFPNTFLYFNNDPTQCCAAGFHQFDFEPGDQLNGFQPRFYMMNFSSWITPGLFGAFQDVAAHSHEMAEIFSDPFGGFDGIHNLTPWWQDAAGQCQDLMEAGDATENVSNPVYPVTVNGTTYHVQNVALLPWFEFATNSFSLGSAYSYPDASALPLLSPPQAFNCGH